ncbi:MAG: hypothetical protein R3321_10225 [Nitrososphaeraceae archaeon]|nr:hypothetical protein [Nitrososphaeraceae archaeon]
MLVKVNSINHNKVYVTELDIDDYGSIIPLKDFQLSFSSRDKEIYNILKNAPYAAVFTASDFGLEKDGSDNNILLANPITIEELNIEKKRIIDNINRKIK